MTLKKGNIDFSKVVTQEMRDAEEFSKACTEVRNKRDGLLQEVVWIRDRHRDEMDIVTALRAHNLSVATLGTDKPTYDIPDTSLNEDEYRDLVWYIQALRNVPQQEGFPHNVKWPDKPSYLK